MTAIALEQTLYLHLGTTDVTTGASATADTLPVVTVTKQGVPLAYSPPVTLVAEGLYLIAIAVTAANLFTTGSRYSLFATATVGGITGRDGIGEFEVLAVGLNELATPVQIASAVGARAISSSLTSDQSQRVANAILFGKVSGAGTGIESFRNPEDTKIVCSIYVDSVGNRNLVVVDAS